MDSILGRIIATILTLIAIGGVGMLIAQGFQGAKVSDYSQQSMSLSTDIQRLYTGYATYDNVADVPVSSMKSVSGMWASPDGTGTIGGSGNLIDPWGNNVFVESGGDSGLPGLNDSVFVVNNAGTNFDEGLCTQVAKSVSSAAQVFINDVSVNQSGLNTPLDPVALATQCGTGQSMAFVFGQ